MVRNIRPPHLAIYTKREYCGTGNKRDGIDRRAGRHKPVRTSAGAVRAVRKLRWPAERGFRTFRTRKTTILICWTACRIPGKRRSRGSGARRRRILRRIDLGPASRTCGAGATRQKGPMRIGTPSSFAFYISFPASYGNDIFDFLARRGLGKQLEESKRPECKRDGRILPMLHAADIAMRTDALCTGTGAGPAPRLSSSESATDDGAVPCSFSCNRSSMAEIPGRQVRVLSAK